MGYDDPLLSRFRDTIRRERVTRKWTQGQLADRMKEHGASHATWSTIAKIEAADRGVQIGEAVAIADAFGVSVDRLLRRRARPTADLMFTLRQLAVALGQAQMAASSSAALLHERASEVADIDEEDGYAAFVAMCHKAANELAAAAQTISGVEFAGGGRRAMAALRAMAEGGDDA